MWDNAASVAHSLILCLCVCSPLTCAFASVDDFDYNYRGGIYIDHTNATDSNHDVEVVGWGFDPGTKLKYWIARNSCQCHSGVACAAKDVRCC